MQKQIIIYIWEIIMYLFIVIAGIFFIRIYFKKKYKFLKYKEDRFSNLDWTWEWRKNEDGYYNIYNLNMLCPNCNNGVFTVASIYSREYDCLKCGYSLSIKDLSSPSHDQIEDEIFNEVKKKFPNEINKIKIS